MGGVLLHVGVEQGRTNFQAQALEAVTPIVAARSLKTYTLLFVGDIMLTRGVEYITDKQGDLFYPFRFVADEIRKADFAFANLEGPISNRGSDQGSMYSFRMRPGTAGTLALAGFDALSTANNHMWDWGRDALEDTIELLTINNIQAVGAGMNYADANEPKYVSVHDIRVGLLGYTNLMPRSLEATATKSGLSSFEPEIIAQKIADAKKQADLVVISLHWGEEYEKNANAHQREFAHKFIDAGADLVIGHHPHVVQEVESYKDGFIAYSLGNFIFDQSFSKETMEGLMLKVTLKDKKIESVKNIPLKISETFQPEIISI